jgi:predicted nucleic acid-binding protein
MTWVLDSTVVLNFGRFEALWVVDRALLDHKVVVTEVVEEILRPPLAVKQIRVALADDWLGLHRVATGGELAWLGSHRQQMPRLGAGEAASLAACLMHGWAFASDDQDARRFAAARSISVTGTIGILLRAIRLESIDNYAAEELLRQMIAAGYRSPIDRLADLLDPLQP